MKKLLVSLLVTTFSIAGCATDSGTSDDTDPMEVDATVGASAMSCVVQSNVATVDITIEATLGEGQSVDAFLYPDTLADPFATPTQSLNCGAWTAWASGYGCERGPGQPERQSIHLMETDEIDPTAELVSTELFAHAYAAADEDPSSAYDAVASEHAWIQCSR